MRSPDDQRLTSAGGRELAAVSAFSPEERLQLPFDLQRSPLFLAAAAGVALLAVAVAISLKALAGLALIAGIALVLAVALNELLGLALLAALIPVTSGLARGFPVPGFRLSEILVGAVAVVLIVSARRVARWKAVDWMALVYATATLALGSYDLMRRGAPFTGNDWGVLFGPFQFLLLYRAVALTARTAARRRFVVRLMLVASVPVSLLAIGQQLNVLGMRALVTTLTGSDIYSTDQGEAARATGPFPHWHNLGGYLFMIILVVVALLLRRVEGVLPRWALIAIGLLDVAALVETLSIAPIFGVIAGSLVIAVWLGQLGRLFIGVAVAILLAALVFGPRLEARYTQQFSRAPGTDRSSFVPQTVQYRYNLWTTELLPGLKGRWVTGYGPDLPPEIQRFPYTESQYIGLLYRGGVVLLVLWFGLAIAMGSAAWGASRGDDPLQQVLGPVVFTALGCLLLMQLIEAYFVDSGTPHVLWILVGLLAFREADVARGRARGTPALAAAET